MQELSHPRAQTAFSLTENCSSPVLQLQINFIFNTHPGKPSVGQIFEDGAFGIEVSISSKLGFSERFMPVALFRKTAKIP